MPQSRANFTVEMMINRKDTPAPPMQRRDLHATLPSPPPPPSHSTADPKQPTPQTPRNRIRTKRASNAHRPTPRETYIEANARSAADENVRNKRISHDLSLTDNARHSVVDNMLLSLNPDQPKLFTPPKDIPPFTIVSDSAPSPKRAPRHLHSTSVNSDFSFPPHDSPGKVPAQVPRSRRSNSSTAFQSARPRIDSVHDSTEATGTSKAKVYQVQRAGGGGEQQPGIGRGRGRGRKESQGSGSLSIDIGDTVGQSRFPSAVARRSASFDNGQLPRGLHSTSNSENRPPLPSSLSQPILYDYVEAAPTPTVPGGPRKDHSPTFPPQPMHLPSQAPMLQRRNSNKSSKSHGGKKKKGENVGWEPPVPNTRNHAGSKRTSKQISPVPTFMRPRNLSPIRHFSEPTITSKHDSVTHLKDNARERPGFFRRVFGSSRAPVPVTNDVQSIQIPPSKTGARAESREGYASPYGLNKPLPADDGSHSYPETVQPPLAKKPSSFFRRRKKSVSENIPPPVIPSTHQKTHTPSGNPAQRSPVSSLRKVMNPYLDNPLQQQRDVEARNRLDTSGQEVDDTQTARHSDESVRHKREPQNEAGTNLPLRQTRLPSPAREIPSARECLRTDDEPSSKPSDDSFLHDDSSNETGIPGVTDGHQLSRHDTVRLDQAPSSLTGNMATLKENVSPRTKSKGVTEKYPQRSMDPSRNVLLSRDGNVPATSVHGTSPLKPEARDWLAPSQTRAPSSQPSPPGSAGKSDRVWLKPANSEEDLRKKEMSFPAESAQISPISDYHSASSALQPFKSSDEIHFPEPTPEDEEHKFDLVIDPSQPSEDDRVTAKHIFDGDEDITSKEAAAAWLGEPGSERMRVRVAYMELYDWQNLNILAALRGLCNRLYLKGEAQQVDRILEAFSTRWCACNPDNGFKATGVCTRSSRFDYKLTLS